MKKAMINLENGDTYSIDVHLIADDRAKYYADKDSSTTYEEEYSFTYNDNSVITDWLFNNMDWYTLPLTLEKEDSHDISELEILDYTIEGDK